MLILAGVSINLVLGPNGLITKAQEAALKTDEAQEKELIEMAITSSKMENVNTLEISKTSLEKALREQFGNNKDFTVTDNGDGSFLINMNDTQRNYYVESTGDIIDDSNMIEIGTAEELKAFRDDVNSGNTYEGKYVKLTNDITLNIEEEWEPIGLYLNDSETPDDENNKPFKGIFDGNGHEVDGIYIDTTDKVQGLFGLVDGGNIKNIIIGENCSISGKNVVSALVGYAFNNVSLCNSINLTSINGETNIGGIVGIANSNCTITNCNNRGNINATNGTSGGLVGYILNNTTIKNCQNNGEIVSNEANAGGITAVANSNSRILNCFNNNRITGGYWVGGIVGNSDGVSIIDCYNTKNITSTTYTSKGGGTAGISGKNTNSEIENCYNIGEITGTSGTYIGAIAGVTEYCYIKNSYWLNINNIDIIGSNDNTQIDKESSFKNDTELKQIYNILGENFKEDINNINSGYPILKWQ